MAALVPPFTASDMQGLYKKIIRGVYPSIPNQYSPDLSNVLRTLLQVNPTLRPSCEKILEMPPVQRHINIQYAPNPQGADLLGTIKFEPGFKNLKQKLPAPNYDSRNRGLSAHSSRPAIVEENPPVRLASAKGRDPQGQIDGSKPMPRAYPAMEKYEPQPRNPPTKAELDYRPQIREPPRYQPRREVHEPIVKKDSDPLLRKPTGGAAPREELFKIPESKVDYTPYIAPYRADRYAQLYNELNSKPSNPVAKAPSYENNYPAKPASREAAYQLKPSSREAPYQIKPSGREAAYPVKPASREAAYQVKPSYRDNAPQLKPPSRENPSYLNSPNKIVNPYPASKPQSRENPSSYQQYNKPPSRENPPQYQPYPNKPPSRENRIAPNYNASPQSRNPGYLPQREAPASRENMIGNYYIAPRDAPSSREGRPSSKGLDQHKNLNKIGAIVLQSPKQLVPKGLPSPQANPSNRVLQGRGQQKINPVWWG